MNDVQTNNKPKRGFFSKLLLVIFLIGCVVKFFNLFIDYRLSQMDLTEVNITSGKHMSGFIPDPLEDSIRVKFKVPRAYTKYFIDAVKSNQELVMYATYPGFKTYNISDNEEGFVEHNKIDDIRISVKTTDSPFCYSKKVSQDQSMKFLGERDYALNLYGFKGKRSYSNINGKLVYDGMNYFLPIMGYDYIKEIKCSTNLPGFPHKCVPETYNVGPFCIVYTYPDKFLKDWKIIDQEVRDFIQQFIVEYRVNGEKKDLNISNLGE